MNFRSRVIPSGNATAVEVPRPVLEALGAGARPPVAVTINGHTWRTRIASMRGLSLVGISARDRAAARIAEGDDVAVDVVLDEAPRDVPEPPDLKAALDARRALRDAFERLAFGLRQKRVRSLEEARSPETRQRRLAKLIADLGQGSA